MTTFESRPPRPSSSFSPARTAGSRRPGIWIAAAAIVSGLAGGVAAQAVRSMRVGPPILLAFPDRDEVRAVNRTGERNYDDRQRAQVVTPLEQSFAALERVAADLGQPLIADVARDGLDIVRDLRTTDTDPIIASRVDLLRLRDAVAAVETDVDTVAAGQGDAATLRLVRATVSDARLRAAQTRLLVARFAEEVVVRKGSGGNRRAAVAPIDLIEELLVAVEATLERRHEGVEAAGHAAWRTEVRARLDATPGS